MVSLMQHIETIHLNNYGDGRGALYNIPDKDMQFLNKIQNIHFGSIRPGSIRGNHYHYQSKEMLIILYSDIWTLAWAKKDSEEIFNKEFTGSGSVLIKVNEGIAHSVKNTEVWIWKSSHYQTEYFPKKNRIPFPRLYCNSRFHREKGIIFQALGGVQIPYKICKNE